MDSSLPALAAFHERYRARSEPLVLATIVETSGSTYRKAGGRMLLAASGELAGLLSGGCLEADLLEHARDVLAQDRAKTIEYDQRSSLDPVWGLGMGCEGSMRILLQPLTPGGAYRPFPALARVLTTRRPLTIAVAVESRDPLWPVGRTWVGDETPSDSVGRTVAALCAARAAGPPALETSSDGAVRFFIDTLVPPPRLLILGGGPDAVPVVEQAGQLGWSVTLVDHRPAYLAAERFPRAERIVLARPGQLEEHLSADGFDAAVVMSHHLVSDGAYLRWLAGSSVRYVGLLGPAARRERLQRELGDAARRLEGRLFGPVGLDIGATTPEAIALAIVAEIHAVLSERAGGSYSAVSPRGSRAAPEPSGAR